MHGQTVGWDAVPLEALLRRSGRLAPHVPLFIENGARTLGQAEMWFGGGRGAHNAVVVLFGSGVGACVVTDEVEQGRAVEWGHLTVRVRVPLPVRSAGVPGGVRRRGGPAGAVAGGGR
ncbi:hypothetical protein STENM327S_05224 [Streptomyces tendae]